MVVEVQVVVIYYCEERSISIYQFLFEIKSVYFKVYTLYRKTLGTCAAFFLLHVNDLGESNLLSDQKPLLTEGRGCIFSIKTNSN